MDTQGGLSKGRRNRTAPSDRNHRDEAGSCACDRPAIQLNTHGSGVVPSERSCRILGAAVLNAMIWPAPRPIGPRPSLSHHNMDQPYCVGSMPARMTYAIIWARLRVRVFNRTFSMWRSTVHGAMSNSIATFLADSPNATKRTTSDSLFVSSTEVVASLYDMSTPKFGACPALNKGKVTGTFYNQDNNHVWRFSTPSVIAIGELFRARSNSSICTSYMHDPDGMRCVLGARCGTNSTAYDSSPYSRFEQ